MENRTEPEAKYQKLACEYAKLRAQASVLKKAVLDEQNKCANLRDQVRHRDSIIRRAEQEADSLGFRNKQLEHRVAVLQEEIALSERRKQDKPKKGDNKQQASDSSKHISDNGDSDNIIFEELQKKIMENAQLTSLIDDKERDLRLHTERIGHLEQKLEKQSNEQCCLEKKLRCDLNTERQRNSELETKLVEAASIIGSEDALSASGSETNTPIHSIQSHHQHHHHAEPLPLHYNQTTSQLSIEERAELQKQALHWRTQYEITKLIDTIYGHACKEQSDVNYGTSSAAAGISVKPSSAESKSAQRESLKEPPLPPSKEQIMFNNFTKQLENLLQAKCLAESQVRSFVTEAENLQNCLENATEELKAKDDHIGSINQALQILEEDLTTTRINYEEQISVLTEQVISLSEQLAACK